MNKRVIFYLIIASHLLVLLSVTAQAQVSSSVLNKEKPLWELGLGAIAVDTPDYPGAKKNTSRLIPFPYVVYRGDILRSDDEGRRIRIKSNGNWEIGVSFGFHFPIKSDDTEARKGMPNLDATLEFGPGYFYRFFTRQSEHQLNLGIAARAVYSSNFSTHVNYQGVVLEPQVRYWRSFKKTNSTLFSSASVKFGDASVNQYFYGVAPEYETETRPAYQAQAGLIRITTSLGLSQPVTDGLSIFLAAFHGNQSLTTNKDSPLIEKRENFGGILGFIWVFYQSEETVRVNNQLTEQ